MTDEDDYAIDIPEWSALGDLATTMDQIRDQVADAVGYARDQVAQPQGFETSSICLLQPLAEVMRMLQRAFGEVGEVADGDLSDLADGVRAALAEFQASDARAIDRLPSLPSLKDLPSLKGAA